jgi:hypothetical protein
MPLSRIAPRPSSDPDRPVRARARRRSEFARHGRPLPRAATREHVQRRLRPRPGSSRDSALRLVHKSPGARRALPHGRLSNIVRMAQRAETSLDWEGRWFSQTGLSTRTFCASVARMIFPANSGSRCPPLRFGRLGGTPIFAGWWSGSVPSSRRSDQPFSDWSYQRISAGILGRRTAVRTPAPRLG